MISETDVSAGRGLSTEQQQECNRQNEAPAEPINHTVQTVLTRSHFGSSFHLASPWSSSPDWVYCVSRMTSLPVLIFTCSKTNSKQLGGDVGERSAAGSDPFFKIFSVSQLVWIWFGSAWTQSEQLCDCRCESGLLMLREGWGIWQGQGSIGNMKKQFSLYYISVQSDNYTTQTYILSTD